MNWLSDSRLAEWFQPQRLWAAGKIALVTVVALLFFRVITSLLKRTIAKQMTEQGRMLLVKGINYTGAALLSLWILAELGVKISALLGAAGIVGVALGIASQTSLGNIISGFFLISEKPFEISDIITVGEKTGFVHSIDLLSIKIRTFDNLFIRIPNQEIISTNVVNITRFPIRRMNFNITLAYKEDLGQAEDILRGVAQKNPLCLTEPEPLILYLNYGERGIEILFAVWFEKDDYVEVKNSVFRAIHEDLRAAGIEMPYPHHVISAEGEGESPLPPPAEHQVSGGKR